MGAKGRANWLYRYPSINFGHATIKGYNEYSNPSSIQILLVNGHLIPVVLKVDVYVNKVRSE
jgi:hypothetical protein